MNINTRTKDKVLKSTHDQFTEMMWHQITSREEEGKEIKRTNRAMQNEKEFKEKRLKAVLLSNKETKRVNNETQKHSYSIIITALAALSITIVPIILTLLLYFETYNIMTTCDLFGKLITNTTDLTHQYAETYSNLLLLALIHENRITNFGNVSKTAYLQMLNTRSITEETNLYNLISSLETLSTDLQFRDTFNNQVGSTSTLIFTSYGKSNSTTFNNSELKEVVYFKIYLFLLVSCKPV